MSLEARAAEQRLRLIEEKLKQITASLAGLGGIIAGIPDVASIDKDQATKDARILAGHGGDSGRSKTAIDAIVALAKAKDDGT